MLLRAQIFALALALASAAGGCGGDGTHGGDEHPPVVGECHGGGCIGTTVATPQPAPASGGGSALPGPTFGPAPVPEGTPLPGNVPPVPFGVENYAPGVPVPGSTAVPAEVILGGRTGLGVGGPLANPNTTGPGFGAIPQAGPGPGVGPGFNGTAATFQPGPVCPRTQPTDGAPCDPVANSFACTYGQRTCTCGMTWNCF